MIYYMTCVYDSKPWRNILKRKGLQNNNSRQPTALFYGINKFITYFHLLYLHNLFAT